MLGLKKAADKLARANGVRWYDYFLRRSKGDVLMKAIVQKMDGKRKQGRPKMKWRTSRREHEKDWFKERRCTVADRCRWREGVGRVVEVHSATSFTENI